jgi:hypothetical protein
LLKIIVTRAPRRYSQLNYYEHGIFKVGFCKCRHSQPAEFKIFRSKHQNCNEFYYGILLLVYKYLLSAIENSIFFKGMISELWNYCNTYKYFFDITQQSNTLIQKKLIHNNLSQDKMKSLVRWFCFTNFILKYCSSENLSC